MTFVRVSVSPFKKEQNCTWQGGGGAIWLAKISIYEFEIFFYTDFSVSDILEFQDPKEPQILEPAAAFA